MGIKIRLKVKFSFTLIETILVIGIVSLSLPLIFSIFYSIIRQQFRIYELTQVKREGDQILTLIESTINNYAIAIHSSLPISESNEICVDPTEGEKQIGYFKDWFSNWFRYSLQPTGCTQNCALASTSAVIAETVNLNSDKTKISNFSFSCYRTNNFSPPIIKIGFSICYWLNNTCDYVLNYQTKFKLKNY